MVIIAIANLKGGCAKTTTAVNLAAALTELRQSCLLIDMDSQQSATRWAGQAPGGGVFDLRERVKPLRPERGAARFKADLERLAGDYRADVLLLDLAPELREPTMIATMLAHAVLVPVTPSPLDIWAAEAAAELAAEARRERGGKLPVTMLIPSRLVSGTILARDIPDSLKHLGAVAPGIHQRVAMVEATIAGQTIADYQPGGPSHQEFQALGKYVLQYLRKSVKPNRTRATGRSEAATEDG